jgi:hypothetical protein
MIGESYLSIVAIIAILPISAVLQRIFVGYFIPSNILFRSRFIIYGIGMGLMLGLIIFLSSSIRNQSFEISDFTRWLLIAIPIGGLINGPIFSYKFKELKQSTQGSEDQENTISGFADYRDSENDLNKGRLLLSGGKLSFESSELEGCLFEIQAVDFKFEIHRSKFMGIPNGFSLPDGRGWVNVAFPNYWLKLMEAERKKVAALTTL